MEVKIPDLHRLRNDEHNHFMSWTNDDIVEIGADTLGIAPLHKVFVDLLTQESDANKETGTNQMTGDIRGSDEYRDKIYRGTVYSISAGTCHFNDDVSYAAEGLKIISDKYGNLAKKPLAEETTGIRNFLRDVSAKSDSVKKVAGLEEMLEELEKANEATDELMKSRKSSKAQNASLPVKEIRLKIDDVFVKMMNAVNVFNILSPSEAITRFIKEQNETVKRTEEVVARRLGKSSSSKKGEGNDNWLEDELNNGSNGSTDGSGSTDPYPNAREWSEDIDYQTCASGDIFYIVRNGVKEYYKLLDFGEVATFEPGMDDGGIWEKL